MDTQRDHSKSTIYRFNTPAGGFVRFYEQGGAYGIESDTDPALIDPTPNFDVARNHFEHLLAERYGFEFVKGPTTIMLMDTRTGKPLVLSDRPDRVSDYGTW